MRRLVCFALLLLTVVLAHRPARACGGFAVRDTEPPFLAGERVLLLWDAATELEDFVRETRFERARSTFGFVVPTPAKPEVFAVKDAPFDRLQKDYAFHQNDFLGLSGAGGGGAPPAVEVLSQQRIGSFTAFTLSATDASALDRWLADNGLVMTPEAKPWIAHYVKLHFFFVAFRYEGGDAGAGLTSETVRIRFKTPHPYYPYLEPTRANATERRRLDAWLVTREAMSPVSADARTTAEGQARWTTFAWQQGSSFSRKRSDVARALGAELGALLPAAQQLHVQPFRDERTSREGLGDVLFVPSSPVTFTAEQAAAREHLLPVLDPVLLGEAPPASSAPPAPPPAPSAPAPASSAPPSPRGSCSLSTASESGVGTALVAAVAVLFLLRRRGAFGLLLLAACDRRPSPSPSVIDAAPPAAPHVAAPVPPLPPRDEAARKRAALAVLAGEKPFGTTGDLFSFPAFYPLWRGDDKVATDPRFPWLEVWVGASSLPGERGAAFVRRVADRQKELSACYLDGLRASSSLEGDVVLTFHTNVAVETSPMPAPVNECIKHAFAGFPPEPEPVKVRLTFSRQR